MTNGAVTLRIPRWIQLISLPMLLLVLWLFATAAKHAIFIFLVSSLLAMLLSPLVTQLRKLKIPHGLAVLIVYLSIALVIIGAVGIAGAAIVSQAQGVTDVAKHEFSEPPQGGLSPADIRVEEFQSWLDRHNLESVHVRDSGKQLIQKIRTHATEYAGRALDIGGQIATSVVTGLIEFVVIVVISVYLLLDAPRITGRIDRMFPPESDGPGLGRRVQRGLIAYTRGQLTVSLLIGASSGIGVYVLSLLGGWDAGQKYALILGLWAMLTEVIPYIGPILGAIPAIILALFESPLAALFVGLTYLVIHQLEGHIVVPRVMGQALGAHPLLVIFALLAGNELFGVAGALLSLPLLAMAREVALFFRGRIELEPWPAHLLAGGGLDLVVPVRVEHDDGAPPASSDA